MNFDKHDKFDKIVIWVPKGTEEIKIISKLKDGSTKEINYDENDIKNHTITLFFEKLP